MRIKGRFYKVKQVGPRGFSEWLAPGSRYLLECCDCSLVHEFQFRVLNNKVIFRCRRADGYTRRERAVKGVTITRKRK